MNKSCLLAIALAALPANLTAQVTGRFPPDSLINVKVFPKTTPVADVIAAMRTFAGALGVRCQYCHVGEEGKPLREFDFAKDEKRTKLRAAGIPPAHEERREKAAWQTLRAAGYQPFAQRSTRIIPGSTTSMRSSPRGPSTSCTPIWLGT